MSRERDDFIEAALDRAWSHHPGETVDLYAETEIKALAGRVFDLEEQVTRDALGGAPLAAIAAIDLNGPLQKLVDEQSDAFLREAGAPMPTAPFLLNESVWYTGTEPLDPGEYVVTRLDEPRGLVNIRLRAGGPTYGVPPTDLNKSARAAVIGHAAESIPAGAAVEMDLRNGRLRIHKGPTNHG